MTFEERNNYGEEWNNYGELCVKKDAYMLKRTCDWTCRPEQIPRTEPDFHCFFYY